MVVVSSFFSDHEKLLPILLILTFNPIMPPVLENWRDLFVNWPADLQRRGIIVTSFGEQIPFSAFSTSSNHLLMDRQTPDSLGARTIVLPFAQIAALKIVDVIKPKTFQALGFEGPQAKY